MSSTVCKRLLKLKSLQMAPLRRLMGKLQNDPQTNTCMPVGKLVTLKGTVVRASTVKPLVRKLDFSCPKCGCTFTEELQDGIFKPPNACRGDGCRAKYFLPQKGSAETLDWQKIRLQVEFLS